MKIKVKADKSMINKLNDLMVKRYDDENYEKTLTEKKQREESKSLYCLSLSAIS